MDYLGIPRPDVAKDADVLLIVGPTQSFLDSEIKAVETYLRGGGSLILALEPKTNHNLGALMRDLGLDLKDNYLVNFVDTQIGRAVNPQVTAGVQFSLGHQITKPFEKNLFAVFRLPTEVEKLAKTPEGFIYDPLVKTSEKTMSYKETTFKTAGAIGSATAGMAVQGRWPGSDEKVPLFNAVVFGDSDFITNQLLYQNLNRDLILNTIAFLAKEENLISISPKEVGVTKMQLSETSFYLFIFCFIILLPLVLLVTGSTLWMRRRHA
jgi:ABC-type uncharacterized transport system involved in gliding motility auxiliary subunit